MVSERDLDLKLLDGSLDRLENARSTFSRDLKIAAVLVLGFQFVIFFRFIDLNERQIGLDGEVSQLQDDQKAFVVIQAQLGDLQGDLQKGKGRLSERLQNLPSAMRTQIVGLEKALAELRSGRSSERASSPPPMIQTRLQRAVPKENPLIAGLSEADRKLLTNANPMDPTLQNIVKRVVEQGIIQPLFLALNGDKDRMLAKPFAEKKKLLSSALQDHACTLEKYGARPAEIEEALKRVQGQLQALRITPPQSDRWWRTFQGKGQVSMELNIDAGHAVDEVNLELRSQERGVDLLCSHLSSLVEESQTRKDVVANKILEVQNRYKAVQEQLQSYAKPLLVIAVEPRQAVLCYPLILSALFAYFVWRFLVLGRRAQDLAARYREFGASERIVRVSFTEFPEVWGTLHSANLATWVVRALSVIPGILMAASLQRISRSSDLWRDAPLRLYEIAILLYLLAFAVLIVNSFWLAAGFPRMAIPGPAESVTGEGVQDTKPGDRQPSA